MDSIANLDKVLMEADIPTTCPICHKPIVVGEPMIYIPSTRGRYHEDCALDEHEGAAEAMKTKMDVREERGKRIAETARIRRKGDRYTVPSQSGSGSYVVDLLAEEGPTCTCQDHADHGLKCKHIHAVEYSILSECAAVEESVATPITRTARVTYRQNWPAYDAAQIHEREHFVSLLRGLCEGILQPKQAAGRPRHHLADVIFSLVWRAYSGKSLRRMMGELLDFEGRGIIETAPHFNTMSDYDRRDDLTPLLHVLVEESALPLRAVEVDFAADGTGFSTSRFGRWYDEKYGRERTMREWIKCHAMVGVKTHVVTAVEVTRGVGDDTSDSRQFKGLVSKTAANFDIREVSADKAYLSRENLAAVVAAGGVPYIPFKSNSTGGKGSTLWRKLFHFYQYQQAEFLAKYHKRSNVESAFSMIKAKFGDSVGAKGQKAQENDVLCKVLAHNICCLIMSMYELGIEPEFRPLSPYAPQIADAA